MEGPCRSLVVVLVAIGFLSVCCSVDGGPDTNLIYKRCNKEEDVDETYFKFCLKPVIDNLSAQTADHGYNCYANSHIGNVPCYGHTVCNGGISHDDCLSCLNKAIDDIDSEGCEWDIGVQIQLVDCRVRFEKYEFYE
ncbi:hypothetical protein MLD38_024328 [Melastoma candidum]|uniref:Uncharacterized protein n=1 Tax=Melastoma candidum TaxID=119954 RepID=A0ACB9NUN2_9MYRT|nr:hypothetical protein MLD38_024328 [Melastoma candidum]